MHQHNVVISNRMLQGPMQIHFKRLAWHKRRTAVAHCFEANNIVEAGCLPERCANGQRSTSTGRGLSLSQEHPRRASVVPGSVLRRNGTRSPGWPKALEKGEFLADNSACSQIGIRLRGRHIRV